MDQIKIGRFVAETRRAKGLTQRQLADQLSISDKTISKWETGQSYPDFQRLVLLSDYFGLTLDELVRDVDVADVRARNVNNEKLDSIYNDVGTAKKFIKWYLIIAGGAGILALASMLYFAINAVYVW